MPVEVHDGLLQAQKVVDGTVDDVHRRCVSRLGPQVVLPVCNVTSPLWIARSNKLGDAFVMHYLSILHTLIMQTIMFVTLLNELIINIDPYHKS